MRWAIRATGGISPTCGRNRKQSLPGCQDPFPAGNYALHFPALQFGVVPEHTIPHLPQLLLSEFRSTHLCAQQAGVVPVVHALPHLPQFFASVARSVHLLAQQPGLVPLVHAVPHPPQFFASLVKLAQ